MCNFAAFFRGQVDWTSERNTWSVFAALGNKHPIHLVKLFCIGLECLSEYQIPRHPAASGQRVVKNNDDFKYKNTLNVWRFYKEINFKRKVEVLPTTENNFFSMKYLKQDKRRFHLKYG